MSAVRMDDAALLVLEDESSSSDSEDESELEALDLGNAKHLVWADDGATTVEVGLGENNRVAPTVVEPVIEKPAAVKPFVSVPAKASQPVIIRKKVAPQAAFGGSEIMADEIEIPEGAEETFEMDFVDDIEDVIAGLQPAGILPLEPSRSVAKKRHERGSAMHVPEGDLMKSAASDSAVVDDMRAHRRTPRHMIDEDGGAQKQSSRQKHSVAPSTHSAVSSGEPKRREAKAKAAAVSRDRSKKVRPMSQRAGAKMASAARKKKEAEKKKPRRIVQRPSRASKTSKSAKAKLPFATTIPPMASASISSPSVITVRGGGGMRAMEPGASQFGTTYIAGDSMPRQELVGYVGGGVVSEPKSVEDEKQFDDEKTVDGAVVASVPAAVTESFDEMEMPFGSTAMGIPFGSTAMGMPFGSTAMGMPYVTEAIRGEAEIEEEAEMQPRPTWKIYVFSCEGWVPIEPREEQLRLEAQFQEWVAAGRDDPDREYIMFRGKSHEDVRVRLSTMSTQASVLIPSTERMPDTPVMFNSQKWNSSRGQYVESCLIGRFPYVPLLPPTYQPQYYGSGVC